VSSVTVRCDPASWRISFSREQVASLPKMIGGAVRLILLSRIESQFGLARRIGADAQRHRTTASAVAAWTLTWAITGAIVGGRLPQQVDGWIGAASLQLSAADLQKISNAIAGSGAGGRPNDAATGARPGCALIRGPALLKGLVSGANPDKRNLLEVGHVSHPCRILPCHTRNCGPAQTQTEDRKPRDCRYSRDALYA
jgi:hypothetical protein